MRTDYERDMCELDLEAAARDRWTPRAAALRDEIGRQPWDLTLANTRAWAYSECCDAVYAGQELTPEKEAELRKRCGMEER